MIADADTGRSFDDLEGLAGAATSYEGLKAELAAVEARIWQTHGVRGRLAIIRHLDSGELEEDELVAQWNGLYSAFKQWCKHDPPRVVEDMRQTAEGREERPFCFLARCRRMFGVSEQNRVRLAIVASELDRREVAAWG